MSMEVLTSCGCFNYNSAVIFDVEFILYYNNKIIYKNNRESSLNLMIDIQLVTTYLFL